jgi:hypothetical protein
MSKFEDLVKKIQEDKTLNLNDLKKTRLRSSRAITGRN